MSKRMTADELEAQLSHGNVLLYDEILVLQAELEQAKELRISDAVFLCAEIKKVKAEASTAVEQYRADAESWRKSAQHWEAEATAFRKRLGEHVEEEYLDNPAIKKVKAEASTAVEQYRADAESWRKILPDLMAVSKPRVMGDAELRKLEHVRERAVQVAIRFAEVCKDEPKPGDLNMANMLVALALYGVDHYGGPGDHWSVDNPAPNKVKPEDE